MNIFPVNKKQAEEEYKIYGFFFCIRKLNTDLVNKIAWTVYNDYYAVSVFHSNRFINDKRLTIEREHYQSFFEGHWRN